MNMFEKIVYNILCLKEKSLKKKLEKYLKTSSTNSTSKRVFSSHATVTLTAETEKNIETVKKSVSDIVKSCSNNPVKLLQYIESKGTKVVKLNNADKLLAIIKEEEGLITPLEGIEALYINIICGFGLSFRTKPVFIMREGQIDEYFMAHQFYKWYALKAGLPGFDYLSQKIFKIFLNSDGSLISNLSLDEMTGLKEAVSRDREAAEFALALAREKEGAKKVMKKMKDEGGAQI